MPKKLTRRKSNLEVQKALKSLTKQQREQILALERIMERSYRKGDWVAMAEPLAEGFLLLSLALRPLVSIPGNIADGRRRKLIGLYVEEIRKSLREELASFLSVLIKEMIRVGEKKEHADLTSLLQWFRWN